MFRHHARAPALSPRTISSGSIGFEELSGNAFFLSYPSPSLSWIKTMGAGANVLRGNVLSLDVDADVSWAVLSTPLRHSPVVMLSLDQSRYWHWPSCLILVVAGDPSQQYFLCARHSGLAGVFRVQQHWGTIRRHISP